MAHHPHHNAISNSIPPHHTGAPNIHQRANRFPESAAEDDAPAPGSSPDSENEEVASTQFEMEEDLNPIPSFASASELSESENSKKNKEAWLCFRDRLPANHAQHGSMSATSTPAHSLTNSIGHDLINANVARPAKRKLGSDERFENYGSMSFKRRAVSPSASVSPGMASPTLSQGSGTWSNQQQQQSSLHSQHQSQVSFSPRSYSRGSSPVPLPQTAKQHAPGDGAALGLFLAQRLDNDKIKDDEASSEAGQLARDMDIGL